MELLRLEKGPRSSSPAFNQIPPRATHAQFLEGDSATSLGSLFQCLTTLSMTKFSLISKTTAPPYCQMSPVLHALVWRARGALQRQWIEAGSSREQSHEGFQPCLWRMECVGLTFPKVSPRALRCSSSSGLGSASGTSQGNRGTNAQTATGTKEPLACLLTLRNPKIRP